MLRDMFQLTFQLLVLLLLMNFFQQFQPVAVASAAGQNNADGLQVV